MAGWRARLPVRLSDRFLNGNRGADHDSVHSQLTAQTTTSNPQQQCGLRLIAVGVAKHVRQENAFHVPDAIRVQGVSSVPNLLLEEFTESNFTLFRWKIRSRPLCGRSAVRRGRGRRERGRRWCPVAQLRGQEIRQQDRPEGMQQRVFQNGLKLADVPRPRIVLQHRHRFRRDSGNCLADLGIEAANVILRQERDVIAAFAQRRQENGITVQAVAQVARNSPPATMASRSRFVAATMQTSDLTVRLPPTRWNSFS